MTLTKTNSNNNSNSNNNNGSTIRFSTYDTYSVKDCLDLFYPRNEIKIKHIDKNTFLYSKKDSEGQITEKIISRPSDTLEIEVSPILPMNLPARKTNELMFLRFERQVYVSKNSTIDVFVPFPIEIGIFVVDGSNAMVSFLDCFTCEPLHSRFGLYGSPDNGDLCMYAKVPVQKFSESFVYALTKISITNSTDKGVLVGKVVFPVTEHNMYYVDNTAEAHIDDLSMMIETELGKEIAIVKRVEYTRNKSNWKLAPSIETSEGKKEFVMNRGIE